MEVVSDATVFDRGRMGGGDWAKGDEEVTGEVGGNENAGCEGERFAEASEP